MKFFSALPPRSLRLGGKYRCNTLTAEGAERAELTQRLEISSPTAQTFVSVTRIAAGPGIVGASSYYPKRESSVAAKENPQAAPLRYKNQVQIGYALRKTKSESKGWLAHCSALNRKGLTRNCLKPIQKLSRLPAVSFNRKQNRPIKRAAALRPGQIQRHDSMMNRAAISLYKRSAITLLDALRK